MGRPDPLTLQNAPRLPTFAPPLPGKARRCRRQNKPRNVRADCFTAAGAHAGADFSREMSANVIISPASKPCVTGAKRAFGLAAPRGLAPGPGKEAGHHDGQPAHPHRRIPAADRDLPSGEDSRQMRKSDNREYDRRHLSVCFGVHLHRLLHEFRSRQQAMLHRERAGKRGRLAPGAAGHMFTMPKNGHGLYSYTPYPSS